MDFTKVASVRRSTILTDQAAAFGKIKPGFSRCWRTRLGCTSSSVTANRNERS